MMVVYFIIKINTMYTEKKHKTTIHMILVDRLCEGWKEIGMKHVYSTIKGRRCTYVCY